MILQYLEEPLREYSAYPFWFLNGDLNETEIVRQLEDFDAHGIHGVVLHPRMGVADRIEYLSDLFFDYIKVAVDTCKGLDMKVVLYDEGMYPSGSAGGLVVQGHPELKSLGITIDRNIHEKDKVLDERTNYDGYREYLIIRHSEGTIRGIHFGEDDGELNAPKSADILNPVAVGRFIELTHERYYKHLGEYFGNTIVAFFTDEPSILGRNVTGMMPWTNGFEEDYVSAGGNISSLWNLFDNAGDNDLYNNLILEKESNVYYGALSKWCESHNIALMGHPHQSDDIEVLKWFHIPGQDLVFRWVGPEMGDVNGMDSVMGHCSADAALLMNRNRNANEVLGACNRNDNPWYLTGDDYKYFIDYLAVRGVNMYVLHAFYYSLEGKRSGERPPDVGPGNIWWDYYDIISSYIKRVSALMTDIRPYADVAVICSNRNLKPELVKPLIQNQIDFNYIPIGSLDKTRVIETEDGHALKAGNKIYQYVIGDDSVSNNILDMTRIPHIDTSDETHLQMLSDIRPLGKEDFSDIRVMHFDKEGSECWFIVNAGDSDYDCDIVLNQFSSGLKGDEDSPESLDYEMHRLAVYDIWNDVKYRFDGTLRLRRRASLLICTCSEDEYRDIPDYNKYIVLNPEFDIIDASRQEYIDEYHVRERFADISKVYKGQIQITEDEFNIIKSGVNVKVRIEADEMAELYVNGEFAGVSFYSPHYIDVSNTLKEGSNDMILIITGSLANRYGNEKVYYGLK